MVYYLKAFQLLNCICNLLLCYAALCGLLSSVFVEVILNNINIIIIILEILVKYIAVE
jgi:hypothetical protein